GPVRAPGRRPEGSNLVVAVKAGAGSFCKSIFGVIQRLLRVPGAKCENSRSTPGFSANEYQRPDTPGGFACHCHCRPNSFRSNSSDSSGVAIGYCCPTFGFLYALTGSPVPSPSSSLPMTGQSLFHCTGCK